MGRRCGVAAAEAAAEERQQSQNGSTTVARPQQGYQHPFLQEYSIKELHLLWQIAGQNIMFFYIKPEYWNLLFVLIFVHFEYITLHNILILDGIFYSMYQSQKYNCLRYLVYIRYTVMLIRGKIPSLSLLRKLIFWYLVGTFASDALCLALWL